VESQRLWLQEYLQIQAGWQCKTLPWGLGSKPCEMDIQCDGPHSTLRNDWYTSSQLTKETISIRKLDDILEEAGINTVQLLKLDVEGAEHDYSLDDLGPHGLQPRKDLDIHTTQDLVALPDSSSAIPRS